jgi:hypothetical protein
LISKIFGKSIFTWGHGDLSKKNSVRKEYLEAIYAADNEEYEALISFAKK